MLALAFVTVGLTRDFIRFLKDNEERKLKIRERKSEKRSMKVEALETGINEDTEKVPYPYGHEIRWPWYRRIQLVIGSLTLAPLRIIGLATTLPLSLLIANIVKASAEKGSRRSQVYTKWHQLFLIKFLLSLAKFQIFILGISIRHTGEPASRNEAPMLVLAPHSTFIDGLFLPYHGMVTGVLPSPIAKADVHNMPLIGALLDMCNPIYVERGERRSRSSVVHEIKKRVNVEQPYPQCAIFPEGTNSNAQSLLAFKIGAFIPRVPVQPVCLSFKCWNTIVWTFQGPSLFWCLFYTLSQVRIQLNFNYLPVEKPLQDEDPASFAERVRTKIGKATGLKLSQLTYENGLINSECLRIGLSRETIIENAEKLMKSCELKIDDIYFRLQEFKDLRNQKTNLIDKESLKNAICGNTHSEKEYLKRFSKLIEDNNGELDAASYIKNHKITFADLEEKLQWRRRLSCTSVDL